MAKTEVNQFHLPAIGDQLGVRGMLAQQLGTRAGNSASWKNQQAGTILSSVIPQNSSVCVDL